MFIIKQNYIYKKLQKVTCEPQLTYFVCSFACTTSLTQIYSSIVQNFASSRCFLHKVNKLCKKNQRWHVLYVRGYSTSHALNAKLWNFITLWNLTKSLQYFVTCSFCIELTKIWHKNTGKALALISLGNHRFETSEYLCSSAHAFVNSLFYLINRSSLLEVFCEKLFSKISQNS